VTRKPVVFDSAASAEAEAAFEWYRQRSERAAARFLDELEGAIEQISSSPNRLPIFEFGTRRMLLRRFPYFVVFRETATQLEVVAVAHGHRRPGYWRDRI
jgi:plasmid stabilization system protein ParE